MTLTIGTVRRPHPGETACGDNFVIVQNEHITIALADGLGHGPNAAKAADAFCASVEKNADLPLPEILHRSTKDVAGTRGVAGALLRVAPGERQCAFAGVGNIELMAVSAAPIRPVSMPGVIGRPLRKLKQFDYELSPGDLLAMYTDGISSRLDLTAYRGQDAQTVADAILADHGKKHDDATCIVIRI